MPVEVKVPSVGESITEGSIARWIRKEGDFVNQDEPIFELETEKASQEVPAPASGVLHVTTPEGQKVAIGAVIGSIDTTQEAPTTLSTPAPTFSMAPLAPPPLPESTPSLELPARAAPPPPPALGKAGPPPHPSQDKDTRLSPAARRLATESRVDATQLAGTGKGGLVLKEDVQMSLDKPPPPPVVAPPIASPPGPSHAPSSVPPPPAGQRETRQRMSAIRQRIAERLLAAQNTTASLTTFNEADLSAIVDLRTRYKDRFKEKHGVGLGFMSLFVKASIEALKAFPLVNSRIDGSDIVQHHFYNIGVAVSTDKGLMVPVLRDADRLSFAAIEKAIGDLAARARDGRIAVTDLQGGTFTITNGGTFGSMLSTPILNAPQSAILGMHAIQDRAVVRNGQIVIRPMMYLALTYDHRLIDGREAVQFLVRIKDVVENPAGLLLEV